MHGVGQSLEAARRHAANGADQGEDAAVHQLTGWGRREEQRGGREKNSRYGQSLRSDHQCGQCRVLVLIVVIMCGKSALRQHIRPHSS